MLYVIGRKSSVRAVLWSDGVLFVHDVGFEKCVEMNKNDPTVRAQQQRRGGGAQESARHNDLPTNAQVADKPYPERRTQNYPKPSAVGHG